MKVETVIIGAGLSGLSCAIQLDKERRDYLLVEKANRIGGRLGSLYEKGNIYDIGFQVFNTAYKNTMQLLDSDEVKLKMFKPGSVIHDGKSFNLISDPLRDPKQLFTSLFSSISTFKDKLKVLSLIAQLSNYDIQNDNSPDMQTIDFLKKKNFSDKFIELFFTPFFAGIFLEKDLQTSSKFFKYVFSNFSKGLACLPSEGMQKIPDLIFKNINSDRLLLNQSLEKIEDKGLLIFAACDTFRAAAVEQLEQWASRTKSLFFKGSNNSDAASVAFKALEFSIKEKADYLIVDTAGRLQNKTGLMDELSKICRVISKLNVNAPHNKIVVLDGTVGQNAHSQVKNFNEQIQLTGMIITKLDGSAKGGVIVSLAEQFKLPIFAVGVGEKVDDLDIFKADDYSKALLNLE